MIPSARSPWFSRWFSGQAYGLVRKSFDQVHIAGEEHLAAALRRGPTLVVSNHSSWWDPMFVLVLTDRIVPAEFYAMMEAKNLRRLPFFAKVGGFGVDRDSRRDGARAIEYAGSLLDRPGRLVWIFPQGQERPLHERPLSFFGGAARVAQRNPQATVVPVALSYHHGATREPEAYISIGAELPVTKSAAAGTRAQVQAVTEQLERIEHERCEPGTQGFEPCFEHRKPGSGGLAERLLAAMSRPFVPGLRALEYPSGSERKLALSPTHPAGAERGAAKG
ncbi:MAG: lysophospholipid acyltransferase family protein [Myxococcota bacterium]